MREMRAAALNREDLLGDGAAILGTGKAAAAKPGLEKAVSRLGGLPQPLQYLDGHLQAGSGSHLS